MESRSAYVIAAVYIDVIGSKELLDGRAILRCDRVEQLLVGYEISLLAPFPYIDRLESSSQALTTRIILDESSGPLVNEQNVG